MLYILNEYTVTYFYHQQNNHSAIGKRYGRFFRQQLDVQHVISPTDLIQVKTFDTHNTIHRDTEQLNATLGNLCE